MFVCVALVLPCVSWRTVQQREAGSAHARRRRRASAPRLTPRLTPLPVPPPACPADGAAQRAGAGCCRLVLPASRRREPALQTEVPTWGAASWRQRRRRRRRPGAGCGRRQRGGGALPARLWCIDLQVLRCRGGGRDSEHGAGGGSMRCMGAALASAAALACGELQPLAPPLFTRSQPRRPAATHLVAAPPLALHPPPLPCFLWPLCSWSFVQQELADALGGAVTAHDMPGFGLSQR